MPSIDALAVDPGSVDTLARAVEGLSTHVEVLDSWRRSSIIQFIMLIALIITLIKVMVTFFSKAAKVSKMIASGRCEGCQKFI